MGGDREFNFGRFAYRNKLYFTDDKTPLKGAWSGHVTNLKISRP